VSSPETLPEPEPTGSIRILIADDQWVVRDGLVLLLGLMDGVEVLGAACDGAEAVHLARALRPDIVLMDLDMPVLDGAQATAMLHEHLPTCSVLVLTTYLDKQFILPALRAGARGYLTKHTSGEQFEEALRSVHAGRMWLDPLVQERLVHALSSTAAPADASSPPATPTPDALTPRETQVLQLIAEGLPNTEICHRLGISQATIKTHINRIYTKTGARDRSQAVRYAFRNGLAHPK
jgi:DNA-binding NarL/FixJ family response regulator